MQMFSVRPAAFLSLFLVLALPAGVEAQVPSDDVEGTWHGILEAGGQKLTVIFHLQRGEGGALTATMDVPQQGAQGIPVSSVQATADSLRLEVVQIGGAFAGAFQGSRRKIDGTWRQAGQALPLVLEKGMETSTSEAAASDTARGSGVSGRWQGRLGAPVNLRVVFNIKKTADGTLTATAESPDQSEGRFPVSAIERSGDSLHVEVAAVGASFDGRIGADAQVIEGTFRQRGTTLPLTLQRQGQQAGKKNAETDATSDEQARPQEPEPPLPYDTQEVTFPGGGGDVTLAGTLTLPQGSGPHPAVVLVSGSGPQNRDEELAGHKPFLVLADALTRRGVAVLRYDDRGVAESTGDFSQATTHDFAADARAALDYLRGQDDVNLGKVGLIGHSEGGLVAPMIAAHHPEAVDFIVLLAGPGVPGDALLARQNALLFERSGMSAEGAAAYERRMKAALQRLDAVPPAEPLPDSVRAALRADFRAAAGAMSPADRAVYGPTDSTAFARVLDRMTRQLSTSWMRSFLASDPQAVLQEVDVPVLALLGEKDLQVPSEQNAPALRKALADHPDATVNVLPGLNHLFQTADTGLPGEYSQIEETFAPKALDLIGDWIAERTRADAQQ